MIGVINMMHVFTGKDTYVFEMTRGLITAEELMSIFKTSDNPIHIKGSDGNWCRVETVFKSQSKNVTPIMISTRDGVNTVLGSNSMLRCPTGDLYNPRVISKYIRDLSEKHIIVTDNMESFQNIKIQEDIIKKIAYISRYFRERFYYNTDILESYRASIADINANTDRFNVIKEAFDCSVVCKESDRSLYVGRLSSDFNIITELKYIYGINMNHKDIPENIWRSDIYTRKEFWKYFSEFDDFFIHINKHSGSPTLLFSLKDYNLALKFKLFLTSIGINVSILYRKDKGVYLLEARGVNNVNKVRDPFKYDVLDNTKTWSYVGWSVYNGHGSEKNTISFCSKEKYRIHKNLYNNSFYKEYYKYNIHTKIKSVNSCSDDMIAIGVSDNNSYISLNGIFVRGGF